MSAMLRLAAMNLRTVTPIAATIVLVLTWGSRPPVVILVVVGVFLAASVLAAVHHAEVIAHRGASRSARSCSRSR